MLCWPAIDSSDSFETNVDESWLEEVNQKKMRRVPALASLRIDRDACYAGLYEMSPDSHAIVGQSAECENFFLANGSSGHGVMHSPAIGQAIADMICDFPPAIDLTDLRPSRFAEGAPVAATELL
ncbi:MAG TPA: FAD-binding oxidoreductase, partial [Gemmatimonadaceae bacterium]|nr:FAD-binding oxidoreductase [Gemmatimonadaceae bacterium]